MSCLRIGCTASRNKLNRGHFLPTHPSGSIRRSHTTSKYPPGSEQDALHPIRRATPDQKGCHAYGSGVLPPTTSTTADSSSPFALQVCLTKAMRKALHPIRCDTPDQKGCHAYGSGALPPTTSTTADSSSRHTQAAASDAATQPRNTRPAPNKRRYTRSVALHPIRRGVMPTDRVHCPPRQTHLEPRNPNHCVPAPASGKGALSVTRSVL